MVAPLTSAAIAAWRARTNAALADLTAGFEDRFGYSPGVNAVHLATPTTRAAAEALGPLPADLAALYREIAAADLPDLDHGFFVHPPDLVAAHGPNHWSSPATAAACCSPSPSTAGCCARLPPPAAPGSR
ncbi:hypothetical protein ACIHEI_26260 [Kitasatospora sp. NPDC051984]|uniref:hypothetical protein n=1 Tax=Kitasatospora sp. NPDC051984 TaxID=3364059 RepID=UPI0037C730AC